MVLNKRSRFYKRKFTRRATRKNVRKLRKALSRKVNLDLFPKSGGFPGMLKMTHRYCENIILSASTGTMNSYLFSVNGMYDPNQTGTGHQPLYFDQLSAIYNHYCVIGSKITVKAIPPQTAAGAGYTVALFVNDDTGTANSNIMDIIEQRKGVFKVTGGVGAQRLTLVNKWSAKKNYGASPLANTDLQGTSASQPNEQAFYQICLQALDASSTVVVGFMVEIEYIAIWKELKDMLAS